MARRIDRHGHITAARGPGNGEGVEPLPADLLPLRPVQGREDYARRVARAEWFEARGIAGDWNARVRHERAGFDAAGIADPDPRARVALQTE